MKNQNELFDTHDEAISKLVKENNSAAIDQNDENEMHIEELKKSLLEQLFSLSTLNIDLVESINSSLSSSFTLLGHHLNSYNYALTLDFSTEEIIKSTINIDPMVQFPLSCNLPGNFLFIGGGRYSDTDYSNIFYLYHSPSNTIIFQTTYQYSDHYSGVIFYNWEIYLFGGLFAKISLSNSVKYNLKDNSWNSLQDLPVHATTNNPVLFNDNILLIGFNIDSFYSYSPRENYYIQVNKKFNQNQNKVLLRYKNLIFLLYEDLIYQCNDNNLVDWTVVGNFNHPKHSIKESIETEHGIYFRDYGNLFRMNIVTKEIKCIIDTDYSV